MHRIYSHYLKISLIYSLLKRWISRHPEINSSHYSISIIQVLQTIVIIITLLSTTQLDEYLWKLENFAF